MNDVSIHEGEGSVSGPSSSTEADLRRKLAAVTRFPDQNPNPVLRMDEGGRLIYANPASDDLVRELGMTVGEAVPETLLRTLRAAMAGPEGSLAEVEVGRRTFRLRAAPSDELGFVNIYATDISAVRAIERFPERNPNPVMRVDEDGSLLYANPASRPLVEALGLALGAPLPDELRTRIMAAERDGSGEPIEVQGDEHWFELTPVPIPELGFTNVYGTDVTARMALTRFPNQNPNPVMRISHEGTLLFANPASEHLVAGFDLAVGEPIPPVIIDAIRGGLPDGVCSFDVEASGHIYRLTAVAAFEFGFINVYGTDITAAREVEAAHAENERLLLNILPAPIARRLRAGERIIADRHEDLTLLLADIVGFTQMSASLAPEQVIDLLDDLFRGIDELVDRHGLEKIKTIGDAYMVVGGLPPDTDDHVARVASMALDLSSMVGRRGGAQPIHLRIGMHSGPAVAGVIGARKFIYDVWGDTVNIASRLETYGVPDAIQVTDTVRRRLADRFEFEPRGLVDLKGMGPTHTWFLRGRRADHASWRTSGLARMADAG